MELPQVYPLVAQRADALGGRAVVPARRHVDPRAERSRVLAQVLPLPAQGQQRERDVDAALQQRLGLADQPEARELGADLIEQRLVRRLVAGQAGATLQGPPSWARSRGSDFGTHTGTAGAPS